MESKALQVKRNKVRAECARLGITIERQGQAYRLRSKRIDMLVADLTWIQDGDLKIVGVLAKHDTHGIGVHMAPTG